MFNKIFDEDNYTPIYAETQTEYVAVISVYPFRDQNLEQVIYMSIEHVELTFKSSEPDTGMSNSCNSNITIVHNDIVCAIDVDEVSVFLLSDLNAAFDTVDHSVLLDLLKSSSVSNVAHSIGLGHTCRTGPNRFALHQDNLLLSVYYAVIHKVPELVSRSLSYTRRI